MHRLVQLSVRTWLEIHLELARWQQKSRAIMAQIFPNGKYESWTECQRLLPHAKDVMKSNYDIDDEDQLNATTLSSNCEGFLDCQGAYEEAESMHQWALEVRDKVLGCEHPDTLASVSNLGLVLNRQGRYEEAERVHRRALEGYEKVLRRDHPDTLTSVSNLGYEKVLRRDHPDTLTSVGNLGLVLDRQGKYEEAEAMHRRALAGYGEVFRREHPFTLTSFEHLRAALEGQGKYIRGRGDKPTGT
ncbi:uncharacterized protein N7484_010538 [Penicillium longicatenatum]|uniref:uncharacterized protein n=1 Tax=Penicillium longicatenatum TaxID=1561947 RepID=UPI002546874D|nr:uncharacterized protein N7484_010538 [Penicillium longicatenatum]KAJ5630438.1 hypothetical protein N7484_010538 [Penicillium longicatenatum]